MFGIVVDEANTSSDEVENDIETENEKEKDKRLRRKKINHERGSNSLSFPTLLEEAYDVPAKEMKGKRNAWKKG